MISTPTATSASTAGHSNPRLLARAELVAGAVSERAADVSAVAVVVAVVSVSVVSVDAVVEVWNGGAAVAVGSSDGDGAVTAVSTAGVLAGDVAAGEEPAADAVAAEAVPLRAATAARGCECGVCVAARAGLLSARATEVAGVRREAVAREPIGEAAVVLPTRSRLAEAARAVVVACRVGVDPTPVRAPVSAVPVERVPADDDDGRELAVVSRAVVAGAVVARVVVLVPCCGAVALPPVFGVAVAREGEVPVVALAPPVVRMPSRVARSAAVRARKARVSALG